MTIKINTPGGDISYDIQVMKVGMYSLDEIFDKNLLFLIPFYIFSHESRFKEYAENEEKLFHEKEETLKKIEELSQTAAITVLRQLGIKNVTPSNIQKSSSTKEN